MFQRGPKVGDPPVFLLLTGLSCHAITLHIFFLLQSWRVDSWLRAYPCPPLQRRHVTLGAWWYLPYDLWHWHHLLPVWRPALPSPHRRLLLLQLQNEHHQQVICHLNSWFSCQRWMACIRYRCRVEYHSAWLLPWERIPSCYIHPSSTSQKQVLHDEHRVTLCDAVRTHHDRVFPAPRRGGEDLFGDLRASCLHRVLVDDSG